MCSGGRTYRQPGSGYAVRVFDLMLELNQKMNTALVIVTHDLQIADRMDKIVTYGISVLNSVDDDTVVWA